MHTLTKSPMENAIPTLNGIEPREYQINIFNDIWFQNSIVVLPTGLGKTVIAAMVAAGVLRDNKGKVMFLAPTKPLVDQHVTTFRQLLDLHGSEICALTGEIGSSERSEKWVLAKVIVSTPQVAWNDLKSGIVDLDRFGLIIFDEVHRAVGNYQYVEIARAFMETRSRMILGLTASPGSKKERLDEITAALDIEKIIIKTDSDPDVAKYINEIKVNIIKIKQPEYIMDLYRTVRAIYLGVIDHLRSNGILPQTGISRKLLITRVNSLVIRAKKGEPRLFSLIPYLTAAIRIDYAMEYLESQGFAIFHEYFTNMLTSEEKSMKRTVTIMKKSDHFDVLMEKIENADVMGLENPKLETVLRLCEDTLGKNSDSRIIVFTHFRKTCEMVASYLAKESSLLRPVRFVGQASRENDIGLSRDEQHKIVEQFRAGKYNVLVATSVAEEGLDIPATDLVVFYEPVPSDIRTIQRRGRTGRARSGAVHILTFEGSRDIGYLFSSARKERQMRRNIAGVSKQVRKKPQNLFDY